MLRSFVKNGYTTIRSAEAIPHLKKTLVESGVCMGFVALQFLSVLFVS